MESARTIDYTRGFKKQYRKASLKIQHAFARRVKILVMDPGNPQLRNHELTGQYSGYRSINVTGDWRAIYQDKKNKIIFVNIGTHSQLYK